VRFSRDPAGSTIRRDFARGGAVVDAFDPVGRLTSRQVVKPGAGPTAGEPEWLGAAPPGTVYKSYGYSPINEITEITTAADGTTELEYDVRRRLVRKRPRRGPEELWSTNGLGDYFERGPGSPTRSYLSGGRIAAKAATDYTWDDRGFLIEKRKGLPEGGSERWRYTWNGSDLLSNVELPDGRTVELEYDAWARRALKRLRAAQRLGGGGEVLSTTHYVWDRHMLVHEVQLSGNDTGGSRTYLFENEDLTPLAQREGSGEWIHYVGDVCETPDELVDSAGNLVGRLTRSTFGAANAAAGSQATTPFRAPGQFADDEIGLHYNRYRYYDPETGHYISPDPIGTSGGTNLYGYGPNPIGWFDPLGWQGHQAIAAATAPPPPPGGSPIPLPPPDGNGVYNAGPRPGPNGAPTYPNGQDPRNHTERQILSDLQSTGQAQGAKVNISGQLPPCPQCHRAMQAFAKANGATINYTYNGNTVTYGPGGATSGSPGDAATLVGAYAMKSTPGAQNTATEGTPGANGYPYGYQNYSNAWNTYASQKNPIQQAGQTGPNAPPPTPAQPKFP
jgi:RHS repeat-associated protein